MGARSRDLTWLLPSAARPSQHLGQHLLFLLALCGSSFLLLSSESSLVSAAQSGVPTTLRFNSDGTFKILQIADMHYGNGATTPCRDLAPKELRTCSDVNTTLFIQRLLSSEKPDLVVFTGDNIDLDASNATKSMDAAFQPVIDARIPWAAILGNHDHESNLPREDVMRYLTQMDYSLSQLLNPSVESLLGSPSTTPIQVNGIGNYYLQVLGPQGSDSRNTSLLNLYFLDTGAYSNIPRVGGYDWIRASQILWYQLLAAKLRESAPEAAAAPTPAVAYFHIPIPEYESVLKDPSKVVGEKQEAVLSPLINSGFFTALLQAGDVKATFAGHDHTNDYCGDLMGIHLCYGGGLGYHAYGKVGWSRRARVVEASLKTKKGIAQATQGIFTWKQLDDSRMSKIDPQILYNANAPRRWSFGMKASVGGLSPILLILLTLVITACSSFLFNTLYAKYRRKVGVNQYSRVTEDTPLEPSNYPIDSDNSDDD